MMGKIGVAIALLVLPAGQAMAGELAALDQDIAAQFSMNQTSVSFNVCGTIDGIGGCFGSATLSPPFDYACGVLQGAPETSGNTVTRAIYVLDKRTSSNSHVTLYVFERKDVIGTGSDSVSATLKTSVDLNITGGSGSHCLLAGSTKYVYASTDASSKVVLMKKTHNNIYGTIESGQPLAITTDERGWIAIQFSGGYYVVDPDGDAGEEGGGTAALASQRDGWIQN
jgi:hypothetical protein